MASGPADSKEIQIIPVYVVGGGKKEKQILVPHAAASPGDTVMWDPRDGVKRIVRIKFKKAGRNPFHTQATTFDNPAGQLAFSKGVLTDTPVGTSYEYEIKVKPHNGPTVTLDPDLDIVG